MSIKIGNLEIRRNRSGTAAYITDTAAHQRNKREIGSINLATAEVRPGHAQHEQSVRKVLELNGTDVLDVIARVTLQHMPALARAEFNEMFGNPDEIPEATR